MSEELGESAVQSEKKSAKAAPKAPVGGLFADVAVGRALVLVPEDIHARREVMALLEEALTAPGSRNPRVLTSINLNALKNDASFAIYTAVPVRKRGETSLKLSAATLCSNHVAEAIGDGLGDDIDFGVASEPIKVLSLPSIVTSIQRGVGPNWRVGFSSAGVVRLLNT